jgi:hypothetical protein
MTYTDGASLGFGVSLSFTPATGTGAGVPVALEAIFDVTPPNRSAPPVKWTPLDGSEAGKEQAVAGKIEVTECSLKCAYTAARFASIEPFYRVAGTYVLTLNDGTILTALNSVLTKLAIGQITDSAIQTIELTFTVPGGWTSAGGTVVTLVQALTAGTATLDLTASPVSGTGKRVVAVTFLATATNANEIVIKKGASSGFDGLGDAFEVKLAGGQSATVYGDPAGAVLGSGNKALDLTGTLAQSVTMSILMV